MKSQHASQVQLNMCIEYIPQRHVFSNGAHCTLVQVYRNFAAQFTCQMQGRTTSSITTLKMEKLRSSEAYVNVNKINIPHLPK
jgi:hypothetical protein